MVRIKVRCDFTMAGSFNWCAAEPLRETFPSVADAERYLSREGYQRKQDNNNPSANYWYRSSTSTHAWIEG